MRSHLHCVLGCIIAVGGCRYPSAGPTNAPPNGSAAQLGPTQDSPANTLAHSLDPSVSPPWAEPASAAGPPDRAGTYQARTTQLLEAAGKGRLSLVIELLKQGADVNDKDDDGQTALHKAAAAGHQSVAIALATLGADLTEKDSHGMTPLMAAAQAGNAEIVTLLSSPSTISELAKGAVGALGEGLKFDLGSLNQRLSNASSATSSQVNIEGRNALMLACAGGHLECVKSLMGYRWNESEPRMTAIDKQGRNALMLAAEGGHAGVITQLLTKWFDDGVPYSYFKLTAPEGKTAYELALAAEHKAAARIIAQETVHRAAAAGEVAVVKQALEEFPDLEPRRLLENACKHGSLAVARLIMERAQDQSPEEKLRLMDALPAPTQNWTKLMSAVYAGNRPVVEALLDRKWWNDDKTLIAFIQYRSPSVDPVLQNAIFRQTAPELVDLVRQRLAEVEKKE